MNFSINHVNLNVAELQRSLDFYRDALGLKEVRRKESNDGSFTLVYLSDDREEFFLELTWLKERTTAYELGDNETHIAFVTEDFDAAQKLHQKMGIICFENRMMGIYFIVDPDGYWHEILPKR